METDEIQRRDDRGFLPALRREGFHCLRQIREALVVGITPVPDNAGQLGERCRRLENSADDLAQFYLYPFIDDSTSIFKFADIQRCMIDSWS